ncbi:MAG: CHAP domain-containing protein [Bacillota bacterium]|nr:CHAP domain-containing protein [Bacillota bacterium]MDW7684657.1 CHAP domain-containing protein [Bacillota bacterium]
MRGRTILTLFLCILVILFSCVFTGALFANEPQADVEPDPVEVDEAREPDEEEEYRDPWFWPDVTHPAYSLLNPFYHSGVGGQCTGFVWGRVREKMEAELPFRNHAKYWWDEAEGVFARGILPAPNSIAVWTSERYGHVAFVESVDGDLVTFNEGNWNTFSGDNGRLGGGYDGGPKTLTRQQMEVRGIDDEYQLLGYIYLGEMNLRRLRSDFTGDRRDDIMAFYRQGEQVDAWVFLGWQLTGGPGFPMMLNSRLDWDWEKTQVVTGDFIGDGAGTLMSFTEDGGRTRASVFSRGGLASGIANSEDVWEMDWNMDYVRFQSGDFVGDGRDDVLAFVRGETGRTEVWLGAGAEMMEQGFVPVLIAELDFAWDKTRFVVGDFDGDTVSDLVAFEKMPHGLLYAWWIRGSDIVEDEIRPLAIWQGKWDGDKIKLVTGDFSGDFRDDIMAFYKEGKDVASVWAFHGRYITSSMVEPMFLAQLNWNWDASQFLAGDFNGDRLCDIAGFHGLSDGTLDVWWFSGRDLVFEKIEPRHAWRGDWDAANLKYAGGAGGENMKTMSARVLGYDSTQNGEGQWVFANTVVVAPEAKAEFVSLEIPPAYLFSAPVLFTKAAGLSYDVRMEIKRLGAQKVVILGESVSVNVEKQLLGMGVDVERLAVGKNVRQPLK